MIIIKNNFQINDHFLNDLSHLINGEIKLISSCGGPVDLESSDKPYDNISIAVVSKNEHYNITIRSLFFYSENIDDEVNNLQISFGDENVSNPQDVKYAHLNKKIFEINKIKIYGEERIRIWSELKKRSYFDGKIDIEVGDYYFNNTIIRFESSDGRCVNIFAYRHVLHLDFNKILNIENDFYLVSDLKMGEDFASADVWTDIQKIKCHYEIGEKEVIKFIDKEMHLYE